METAESVETEFTWGNQKEVASQEAANRNQDTDKSHEDKNKNLDKLQSKNTHKHTHTYTKDKMCRNPCLTSFGPLSLWKKVKQQRTLIVPAEQTSSRCPGKEEEEEGGRSKATAVLDLPPWFSLL